ncbi:MAG: zinc-dependent alcohol dehydrogenase family protein [Janthinobacterium lividum]
MPKAVRFHELGGPDVLKIEEVPLRQPAKGEVAIDVAAVGLNRAESMFFHGQYLEQPQLPSGLGYEAVGKVTAVGPDVDPSLVGKRVGTIPGFSMNQYPVLAEKAIVPAHELVELPPSLSDIDGAAAWMQYTTAYGALVELGKVGPGDFVLITAASSSVGLAAIQITKAQGAVAIATTRTASKKQQLRDFGADHVIVTEDEDLPARVAEITGGKLARIVFDPVGGDYVDVLAQATAVEGTIYLYGMLSGKPTPYPASGIGKGIALTFYILMQTKTPERFERMKRYVSQRLADGTFKPKVDRVFRFDEVVDAYKHLESNQQVGKIVITL